MKKWKFRRNLWSPIVLNDLPLELYPLKRTYIVIPWLDSDNVPIHRMATMFKFYFMPRIDHEKWYGDPYCKLKTSWYPSHPKTPSISPQNPPQINWVSSIYPIQLQSRGIHPIAQWPSLKLDGNVLDEGDYRSEIFDSEISPSDVNRIAVYLTCNDPTWPRVTLFWPLWWVLIVLLNSLPKCSTLLCSLKISFTTWKSKSGL